MHAARTALLRPPRRRAARRASRPGQPLATARPAGLVSTDDSKQPEHVPACLADGDARGVLVSCVHPPGRASDLDRKRRLARSEAGRVIVSSIGATETVHHQSHHDLPLAGLSTQVARFRTGCCEARSMA